MDEVPKVEYFSGKDLMNRIQNGELQTAGKPATQKQTLRSVIKELKEAEKALIEKPEETEGKMLRVKHHTFKNRVMTVGSVIFQFDGRGIATVPDKHYAEWRALTLRPGYCDPDKIVPKVVEKPLRTVTSEDVPIKELEVLVGHEPEGKTLEDVVIEKEEEPAPKKTTRKKATKSTKTTTKKSTK